GGGQGPGGPDATAAITPTPTGTPTAPTTGSLSPGPAEVTGMPGRPTGTAPVEVERERGEPVLVTGVRFGRHDTFDRVVIDLDGGLPGHAVRWVDELAQEGSGKPVDLKGGACLYVLLTPAEAHTSDGTPTWTGGGVPPSLGALTGAVRAGDFEGRVVVGLLADSERPFRVTEHTRPDRLVIDVAH
ncbi:AMIN-like domain-containing (lipo)protein, partial [Nonomuraea lactucae]|uniref:AMIN-like domain-containing (lipo)protein n=1 Tax=Nonomuraea lactucae TaxID=2249762 RepID=UPI000DE2899B